MKLIKEWLEEASSGDGKRVGELYERYYNILRDRLTHIISETEKDKNNYRSNLIERAYRAALDSTSAAYESRLLAIMVPSEHSAAQTELRQLILSRIVDAVPLVHGTIRLIEEYELNTRVRKDPQERRLEILNAAVDLAKENNYTTITQNQIAEYIGVSMPLISKYFSMDELKEEVLKFAIEADVTEIIAQAISFKHPFVSQITKEQRDNAVNYIMGT